MLNALSKWNIGGATLASGWAGKSIIIILFVISVIAIAIFIYKIKEFRKISIRNDKFLSAFHKKTSLSEFYKLNTEFDCPLSRIFDSAYRPISGMNQEVNKNIKETMSFSSMEHSLVKEKHKIESQLIFLATTVVISPFLGLLGTVWGILDAFMDIKTFGSAHINVVAPGMAEALVTTVAGLCVAIPAVAFYNYLLNRANKFIDELEVFEKELINEIRLSL
ncbi:MAG: MotA/TolQ/ExbB proton channel family protein [bacterium]